jgi:hypothetical protein
MLDLTDRVEEIESAGFDPLNTIEKGLAGLAAEDRAGWPAVAKSDRLTHLLALQERLNAEVLRLVGEWDRDHAWEADGSLSAAAWLEHRTPLAPQDARRTVKTARLVDRHAVIGAALADHQITVPHLTALSRVMSKHRAPLLAEHATTLVAQARDLTVRDFTTVMRRWASLADDHLATDAHEQQWERRHLYAATTLDGWVEGRFRLDPLGGQSFLNRLDQVAPPDPADTPEGPRTLAQRRADALIELTESTNDGRGTPTNLNVVVDLPTLTGDPAEVVAARCDLEGVGPITRDTLEQVACCATVTRHVTNGPSVVLDLGRAVRVATPAQKRALAVRDRHCRFPSCDRVPAWCDAHHIVSWLDDGETSVENMVLLCRRHHTLIHQTRWTVTRTTDGTLQFSHPARGP